MMIRHFLIACLLALPGNLLCPAAAPARQGHLIENPLRHIPAWVRRDFTNRHLDDQYKIIYRLYPYTISGDLNGDGRKDVAIQVQSLSTGKVGIAVFHGRKPQALLTPITILGAGKAVGQAGDDFSWTALWVKQKGQGVTRGELRSKRPPDAIQMSNNADRSLLLYWNGEQYTTRSTRKK